jgi:hypothetical protein
VAKTSFSASRKPDEPKTGHLKKIKEVRKLYVSTEKR